MHRQWRDRMLVHLSEARARQGYEGECRQNPSGNDTSFHHHQ
jgi:hypothetical protein